MEVCTLNSQPAGVAVSLQTAREMSNVFNSLEVHPQAAKKALEGAHPGECKILHMAKSYRASQIHVLFIIDELCEMGGAERVLFKIVGLLPPDRFRCSILTFKVDPNAEAIKDISCPLHVLPLRKTYDWNALKVAGKIRRFVKQENVSIVHTFFETSDLWAGPIARLSGCPVLISGRRDLGILRSRKHRIGYKLMGRLYDAVLAVSPQVRQFCIEQDGLNPGRVHTLFNGLVTKKVVQSRGRVVMRQEMGIADDVPVIITVGNIRRVKGIDVLIQAAEVVCRKHPKALFLVVGRKSEPEYCRELDNKISSLGLAGNFRFLGSREDVFAILGMSDVFCLPSRSEGFSNALIEAMASRLPCVVSNVGGNSEVVKHGESGFLVASEDFQDLAARLTYLLDDPSLATEMGLQGEEVIQSRFTAEAMIAGLVQVYQGLIAQKRSERR
jgi:glycosyltransferase involved in cell wall biosynthesis